MTDMDKKKLSEAMKWIRGKRTDYSTAGFSNPEVQKKIAAKRKKAKDGQ